MRFAWSSLIVLVLSAGCTWSNVSTLNTQPPEPPKYVLLLGPVDFPQEPDRADYKASWWHHQPAFEAGVRDWLSRNRPDWTFAVLDNRRPFPPLEPGNVVLTGRITTITYGIPALRTLVGMGAGQERVSGDFEVRTSDGRAVAKFHAREAYLGGFGIGGFDFIDMNTLVRRFAETTAEKATEAVAPKKMIDARR
jgi:hypothetical protein